AVRGRRRCRRRDREGRRERRRPDLGARRAARRHVRAATRAARPVPEAAALSRLARFVVPVWAVALAVLMLGPALGPGYLLSYDMVWVPDLALRSDFLGLGSALPRAVPSDAVVAAL